MFRRLPQALAATLLLAPHTAAFALPDDTAQPIEIEAETMILDHQQGISTYNGRVILTQGSLRIEAERLLVYTRNRKLDRLEAFGSDAGQASFRQRMTDGEEAHGRAGHIEYRASESLLTLRQRALLNQGGNRIQSDRIDYNTASNSLLAGQQDPAQKQQRVRIVIDPADDKRKQSTEQKQP